VAFGARGPRSLVGVASGLRYREVLGPVMEWPPVFPGHSVTSGLAARGAYGVLERSVPTCPERALVVQRWQGSVGDRRDAVIGIPSDGLRASTAHAWVDGMDDDSPSLYLELQRLPAPKD
jgi:hypothetical protein